MTKRSWSPVCSCLPHLPGLDHSQEQRRHQPHEIAVPTAPREPSRHRRTTRYRSCSDLIGWTWSIELTASFTRCSTKAPAANFCAARHNVIHCRSGKIPSFRLAISQTQTDSQSTGRRFDPGGWLHSKTINPNKLSRSPSASTPHYWAKCVPIVCQTRATSSELP